MCKPQYNKESIEMFKCFLYNSAKTLSFGEFVRNLKEADEATWRLYAVSKQDTRNVYDRKLVKKENILVYDMANNFAEVLLTLKISFFSPILDEVLDLSYMIQNSKMHSNKKLLHNDYIQKIECIIIEDGEAIHRLSQLEVSCFGLETDSLFEKWVTNILEGNFVSKKDCEQIPRLFISEANRELIQSLLLNKRKLKSVLQLLIENNERNTGITDKLLLSIWEKFPELQSEMLRFHYEP